MPKTSDQVACRAATSPATPCSPEPTATGRPWPHLNERRLAHRRWPDHAPILDAVGKARQRLSCDVGRTECLCSVEWAEEVGW